MIWSMFAVVLLVVGLVDNGLCKLTPIRVFDDELTSAMMPNERESLDDCHLRYYKYGLQNYEDGPILNELRTDSKQFAHLVAVGRADNGGTSVSWMCGGSLIWENYVLTAARCTSVNGVQPDVVRVGNSEQVRISEIIVHPNFNRDNPIYNDVALLRLEQNVTFSPTIAPACLQKEDAPINTLKELGWSNFGNLLPTKVTLKQVESKGCAKVAGLSDGIKDHQICARRDQSSTCPVGPGGPLYRNLIHNGKSSPFLVGIASSDLSCESSSLAIFTRVSSFYIWIETTIDEKEPSFREWRFNPVGCAFLRAFLRDHERDVIVGETADTQTLDPSKSSVSYASSEFNHVVGIHWKNYVYRRENCSGTLIADDTVLVLAECTSNFGVAATDVSIGWLLITENYPISETHIHPEYIEGSPYNNIAVLKLGRRIRFFEILRPACIWTFKDLPSNQVDVLGRGRQDINFFVRDEQFDGFWPMDANLTVRLEVNTAVNCSLSSEGKRKLNRGVTSDLICLGNSKHLVPESCRILPGAPVQLPIVRNNRYYYYALALNQFGSNCGFGEATVSTRLAAYLNWLQTKLLPNYQDEAAAVQYVNPDWTENEPCTYDFEDELQGICTEHSKCPKIWNDFKAKRRIHFCSSSNVVCCPKRYILKEGPKTVNALDTCSTSYAQFYTRAANTKDLRDFPYIVTVTLNNSPKSCLASLITTQLVATSASCVSSGSPGHAVLADKSSVAVAQTVAHPNYVASSKADDVALLKLSRAVTPSATVFPACIWMNLTHTPLNLALVSEQNNRTARQVVPMYNDDCQRNYKHKLTADHLCVDELPIDVESSCHQVGGQLIWYGAGRGAVPYLVGFHSFAERCEEGNPGVFTRIAGYVDWIRQMV